MKSKDALEKVLAAQKLLTQESTSKEKFESVRTLVKGINPRIDNALDSCSQALDDLEKLKQGRIIELSAEHLPEQSEEEKKRKRALLLFIRSWEELQNEVGRVHHELKGDFQNKTDQQQASSFARIAAAAKGPFGIITIAAIVIVGTLAFVNSTRSQPSSIESSVKGETSEITPSATPRIQAIEFNGKQIPLSEIEVRSGPDCESDHYHAKDHVAAQSIDGVMVSDPGGCGFGRVKDVKIIEVEQ